jgi:hypothetical protein
MVLFCASVTRKDTPNRQVIDFSTVRGIGRPDEPGRTQIRGSQLTTAGVPGGFGRARVHT